MTISDTKKVLAFLYSCYPAAPSLAREDKDRMILSFFRVLYKYRTDDVLNAIVECCKDSPKYIPSVFSIESKIKISTPDNIDLLESEREKYLYRKFRFINVFGEIKTCEDSEKRAEMIEFLSIFPAIQTHIKQAQASAEQAYYDANASEASNDIKQHLGVTYEKEAN